VIRTLIWLDLRRLARDRVGWLLTLALPLALTAIMGEAFGGGGSGISAIPLAVASDLPAALREGVGRGLERTGLFRITWTDSATAARWVRRGRVCAAVVLPDSAARLLLSDRPLTIRLWEDVNSQVKAGIVEQMLIRAVAWLQVGEAVYRSVWSDPPLARGDPLDRLLRGEHPVTIARRLLRGGAAGTAARRRLRRLLERQTLLAQSFASSALPLRIVDRSARPASSRRLGGGNVFDYFLPSLAVFFLMFAVAARLGTLHREREEGTLRRLLVTPLRPRELLAGKWAGAVVVSLVQLGALLLLGRLLLHVHLGNDPWSLPLVALVATAMVSSLFLVLALLTSGERQMGQLSSVLILLFALAGGTFLPTDRLPALLQGIGRLTPTWWLNEAFRGVLLQRGDLSTVRGPLEALLVWSVALWSVALLLLRRRVRTGGWQ